MTESQENVLITLLNVMAQIATSEMPIQDKVVLICLVAGLTFGLTLWLFVLDPIHIAVIIWLIRR